MDSLSITPTDATPASAIAPPPIQEQRKPGVAFALSLLYPGLGHFYCGKQKHGILIAAFFTACVAVVCAVNPAESAMFWGIALRAAIVLYGFGFFDAYYTAREINSGIAPYIVGNNPRVAAMLNLLTAGFGYFYLGSKTKGIIWFLITRAVFMSGIASKSNVVGVVMEGALIVVAIDAFRIARKQLRETFPAEAIDHMEPPSRGLTPLVPLAIGCLLALNYFAIVFLGLMLPHYETGDTTELRVTGTANGSNIEHPRYHVKMPVPEGWHLTVGSKSFIVAASHAEFGCQVGLNMVPNLPLQGPRQLAHQTGEMIAHRNPTYQLLSEGPASMGGNQAYAMNFQVKYGEVPVVQKIVFLQHRLTSYSFVETSSLATAGDCSPMMDQILTSLDLGF